MGVKFGPHAFLIYHYIQRSPESISRVKGEESLVLAGNLKPLHLLPVVEFLY